MAKHITAKQQELLEAITTLQKQRGFSPTIRELATALSVSEKSALQRLIGLVAKGYVSREPRIPRSIQVINRKP